MTSTKMTLGLSLMLGLLGASCGDNSGAADSGAADSGVADSGAADSGAADSGAADSGAADSGAADSGAADSGAADSGPADGGTAAADFAMAQREAVMAWCACNFTSEGYASAAECTAENAIDDAVAACLTSAVARTPAAPGLYACIAVALSNQKACYDAAACDAAATSACDDTEAFDEDACSTPDSPVEADVAAAVDACVLGMAGTCPNTSGSINTLGAAVFTGTTVSMGNDVETDCGGGGSPDQVLEWAAPAAGSYVIDSQGSRFDTILQVQNACDSSTPLACNDDADADDLGLLSRVMVGPLTAGQVILIVIEGFDGTEAGEYAINIQNAP